MYDYLILRDEKLSFLKIEEPFCDWSDVTDIFTQSLAHEKLIKQETENLYLTAKNHDDIGAMEFIKDILNQKTKTLSSLRNILYKIENSDIIPISVDFADNPVKS